MGTRSKKGVPSSPTMNTRSKRRLSLWFVIYSLFVCETNVCLNSHFHVTLFMWDWNCGDLWTYDVTLFMWD
jgi:hypothetical protein